MQKKTKTLISTLIIFILILGGLLGAYFFFIRDASDKTADTTGDRVKNIFDTFFPFGGGSATDENGTAGDTLDENGTSASVPRLRHISLFETAGAVAIESEEDNETLIRFIARETGHVYETTTSSLTQKRISNTTIPRIQNALWAPNGEEIIVQYLDDESERVESFYAELKENEEDSSSKEGSLVGTFLPKDITALTLSGSGDKIFYLTQDSGGSIGVVSDLDGGKKIQVFNSPLKEWLVEWQGGDTLALATKPSSGIRGFLYFLNSKTEKFDKVIGNITELVTSLSLDKKYVLFSHAEEDRPLLSILDVRTDEIVGLSVWTLPEKCVWSNIDSNIVYCGIPNTIPAGDYLDAWYQGLISFSDSIWVIDIMEQTADLIADPHEEVRVDIDVIKPSLSPDEKHLLFIDKKDSTLWSLELQ